MSLGNSFADRLRALRESANLSRYGLAKLTGLSRDYLGDLERGDKEPSLAVARRIAAAFGRGLEVWDDDSAGT